MQMTRYSDWLRAAMVSALVLNVAAGPAFAQQSPDATAQSPSSSIPLMPIGKKSDGSKATVDPKVACTPVYEEIVPMRIPNFDQAALWKRTVGIQGIDRPRALMRVADGSVIAVGESLSYSDKAGLGVPRLQMVRIAKDGRVLAETYTDRPHLVRVADALLKKTAVVILSHLDEDGHGSATLTSLNGAGVKKGEVSIKDPRVSIDPKSLQALSTGDFLVLAQTKAKGPAALPTTSLLWVAPDGTIRHMKDYLPGVSTMPESLRRSADGSFLISGRLQNEQDQDAGWLLKVRPDGEMVFQRPYARGRNSTIRLANGLADGSVIAAGESIPAGSGDKAAWIVRMDLDGNPVWQKYLTGKYSYAVSDLTVLEDGRVVALLAATPTEYGGRRFARVVTLSPEGALLSDESFLEGSNAIPFRILVEGDRRVVLGMAETGFATEKHQDDLQYVTYDAWFMGIDPLPAYNNPCAGSPDKVLDDLPR